MRTPLLLLTLAAAAAAPAASAQIVIAEVYGGGGNNGAPYTTDFIVLRNNGFATVDLSGYSVQYASNTGTTWTKVNLTGSLSAGRYYIITGFTGAGNAPLPYTADMTSSLSISGRRGKVALSSAQTTYSGNTPTNPTFANLVDFVGFGGTVSSPPDQYEGTSPAGDLNVNNSVRRPAGVDTNQNGADFVLVDMATNTPLPVELTAFTAAANGSRVRAAWETASETNNAGFRLDGRASESDAWRTLARAASKAPSGTTLEANRYTVTTDELPAGRHTLRLVQTDIDGVEHVAGTVEVTIAPDGGAEVIVRGTSSVTLRVASEQRVEARMFDATGRDVARLLDATVRDEATMDLPQGLAAGVYFVRITGERFATTRSVVIR